jgi:hypothetical protein
MLDCITAGFRVIARRWWLILIPVVLDIFLWMGPRVGMERVIAELNQTVTAQQALLPAGESQVAIMQQTQEFLAQLGKEANLLSLLSAGIPGIPSLISVSAPTAQPLAAGPFVVQAQTAGQVFLWSIGALFLGTVLSSFYVTAIARAVRRELQEADGLAWLRHALHTWTRLLLIAAVITLLGLFLAVPLFLIFALAMLISPSLAIILVNLVAIVVLWIAIGIVIYLYFVVDAVAIHHAGLLRAIWNSVNIVARNLWPSAGLILIIWLLSNGLMLIWTRLESAAWSTAFGIVANAFIGAGLTAASLIFYIERYRRWQENPEAAGNLLLRLWRGPRA